MEALRYAPLIKEKPWAMTLCWLRPVTCLKCWKHAGSSHLYTFTILSVRCSFLCFSKDWGVENTFWQISHSVVGFTRVCDLLCTVRCAGRLKLIVHWLHLYGRSSASRLPWDWERLSAGFNSEIAHRSDLSGWFSGWVFFLCLCRYLGFGNTDGHWSHWYGLCSVWLFMWPTSGRWLGKAAGQASHLYGLSVLCMAFTCALRLEACPNWDPHSSHLKGFSPVCTTECSLKWETNLNTFKHSPHRTLLSLTMWRARMCSASFEGSLYFSGHTPHWNRLKLSWTRGKDACSDVLAQKFTDDACCECNVSLLPEDGWDSDASLHPGDPLPSLSPFPDVFSSSLSLFPDGSLSSLSLFPEGSLSSLSPFPDGSLSSLSTFPDGSLSSLSPFPDGSLSSLSPFPNGSFSNLSQFRDGAFSPDNVLPKLSPFLEAAFSVFKLSLFPDDTLSVSDLSLFPDNACPNVLQFPDDATSPEVIKCTGRESNSSSSSEAAALFLALATTEAGKVALKESDDSTSCFIFRFKGCKVSSSDTDADGDSSSWTELSWASMLYSFMKCECLIVHAGVCSDNTLTGVNHQKATPWQLGLSVDVLLLVVQNDDTLLKMDSCSLAAGVVWWCHARRLDRWHTDEYGQSVIEWVIQIHEWHWQPWLSGDVMPDIQTDDTLMKMGSQWLSESFMNDSWGCLVMSRPASGQMTHWWIRAVSHWVSHSWMTLTAVVVWWCHAWYPDRWHTDENGQSVTEWVIHEWQLGCLVMSCLMSMVILSYYARCPDRWQNDENGQSVTEWVIHEWQLGLSGDVMPDVQTDEKLMKMGSQWH